MRISPMILFWVALLTCTHLIAGLGIFDNVQTQVTVSVLGLLHCVVVFWSDAGSRISAPAVSSFATGLFVFFPGLYSATSVNSPYAHIDMSLAVTLVFIVHLACFYLFWKPRALELSDETEEKETHSGGGLAKFLGILLLAAGVGASILGYGESSFVDAAAYVGVVLFGAAALRSGRFKFFALMFVALAFIAYMELVFSGFGRLKLGSLGIALAICSSHLWKRRVVKFMLLLGSIPGVLYLAASRVEFTASLNASQSSNVTGLESILSPLARFAQLVEFSSIGQLTYSYGQSFFASMVALVPRSIWPEKPVGLGAELATLFRPDLEGTGHSELALFHGEWVLGFGAWGLLGMTVFYGWFVLKVDRLLVRAGKSAQVGLRGIANMALMIIIGASIVDLVWGGSFTYVARVGPRLLLIGALCIWLALVSTKRTKPKSATHRSKYFVPTTIQPNSVSRKLH